MRTLLLSLLLVIFLCGRSYCDCLCDPLHYVKDAKAIVKGKIIKVLSPGDKSRTNIDEPCDISFSVQVEDVLSGDVKSKILDFKYTSLLREDDDLYREGDKYVFLLNEIKADGVASLFKYWCHCSVIWPLDATMIEKLKAEIKKVKK